MITDQLSRDLEVQFQNKIEGSDIDMTVHVLTTGCWPTYPDVKINLPPTMKLLEQQFEKFYLGNHSGRKLIWQDTLGHCIVKASFPQGDKELVVSLFQAVILVLFNDEPVLTFNQISSKTGLGNYR